MRIQPHSRGFCPQWTVSRAGTAELCDTYGLQHSSEYRALPRTSSSGHVTADPQARGQGWGGAYWEQSWRRGGWAGLSWLRSDR